MKRFKVISDGTMAGTSVLYGDEKVICDYIKFEIKINEKIAHLNLGIPLSQIDLDISVDTDCIKINKRQ